MSTTVVAVMFVAGSTYAPTPRRVATKSVKCAFARASAGRPPPSARAVFS